MFLNSWAIAVGMVAVGLPIAIHFLTRPRPVRLPLSTLRFVNEAIKQRRARSRLRDALVLLSRALAILLLAFAIARPIFDEQARLKPNSSGSVIRVVLLDASQSMDAILNGVTAMERGRAEAAAYMKHQSGLRANLIVVAASPRAIFQRPSQNFEALRDELSDVAARPERLRINPAIRAASEMFRESVAESAAGQLELIVISDFQRSNWAEADFSPLPRDVKIQLASVAPEEGQANLCLLRAEAPGRCIAGRESTLEVEIGNYSPTPQRAVVEVALSDAVYRLEGLCQPQRRTTLVEQIKIAKPGWQVGAARLVGANDALEQDDVRGVALEVKERPHFVLISRQAGSLRPSSSHFLECALAPNGHRPLQASVQLTRMQAAKLNRRKLSESDLIAIDHPGNLAREDVAHLAALMRRGRPIVYVASEPVDAVNLSRLAQASGSGLQMPVDFAAPKQSQPRKNLTLDFIRDDAAPFDVFGDKLGAVASQLRFAGGLSTRTRSEALQDDLLATYADGSACLMRTSSDAGSLVVLNADLEKSNLAKSPAFAVITDRLVELLLSAPRESESAICGEPLVVRLPTSGESAADLQVMRPDSDERSSGELTDEGAGVVWRWAAPDAPGVYQIRNGEQVKLAAAVSIPSQESQLDNLPPDVLLKRLAVGREAYYASVDQDNDRRDRFWIWLAVGCVVCVLAEFTAHLVFRS